MIATGAAQPSGGAAHQRYVVALGSNVGHHRHGPPPAVLRAALRALVDAGLVLEAASPLIASAPVGPSRRRYANGAALVATPLAPPDLLALLQRIEHDFGRVRRGQRWRARTLDLDIVLWSGGRWLDSRLTVPHAAFRERAFVLVPATKIARDWRDPVTHLWVKHLVTRLTRRRAAPR
ncbi:2-amino-4-hydroxy-6-hydroxymethyldihydropteridine diphosphokinase [Novosphingobium sp. FKTRR1]|uniref:2-amino-4-hydroxy-6- hydroxymethyldihydropteridine diphosphokinase n=1 Tax=Novosphingobium sp. FKTRR1 TaxID=2879118 RepID=UPI001CEFFD15